MPDTHKDKNNKKPPNPSIISEEKAKSIHFNSLIIQLAGVGSAIFGLFILLGKAAITNYWIGILCVTIGMITAFFLPRFYIQYSLRQAREKQSVDKQDEPD